MLVRSSNSDKLSNRIVHVSVQLFSNEELALQVSNQYKSRPNKLESFANCFPPTYSTNQIDRSICITK